MVHPYHLALHGVDIALPDGRILFQDIHDSFKAYGRHAHLKTAVIYGGVNQNPQSRAVERGVDVLVATDVAARGIDVDGVTTMSASSSVPEASRMPVSVKVSMVSTGSSFPTARCP